MPHFQEPSAVYQQVSNLVPFHLSLPPNQSNRVCRVSDFSDSGHNAEHVTVYQQMHIPCAIHGSHNIISSQEQQYCHLHQLQHSGDPKSASIFHIVYVAYSNPSHISHVHNSGSGNNSNRKETNSISCQQNSTDSDSAYGSSINCRSRPLSLRLLSNEHNRNPNLHPHYHLTTCHTCAVSAYELPSITGDPSHSLTLHHSPMRCLKHLLRHLPLEASSNQTHQSTTANLPWEENPLLRQIKITALSPVDTLLLVASLSHTPHALAEQSL